MVVVANRFYAGDPRPFLLLTLDLERTGSPWRFDDPDRSGIPHVYGPIDPASVVEVRRMTRDPDGAFLAPVPLEPTASLALPPAVRQWRYGVARLAIEDGESTGCGLDAVTVPDSSAATSRLMSGRRPFMWKTT